MSLLLTGSSGFLGKYLLSTLIAENKDLKLLNRSLVDTFSPDKQFLVDDFRTICNPSKVFSGVEVVVHCAARVHIMNDASKNPLEDFREVNSYGTIELARHAVNHGVERFIFISTIKVNGEATVLGQPFKFSDRRSPEDHYGQSKSEAEEQLLQLANETGLEVVIIRPTLVYGPGVKANFASLLNLVSKGLPLPFARIDKNKRSLVSVQNLVDLIVTCIDHPKAVNQVFLVSDDSDISTASMVKQMSKALGKPNRMLPVPLLCYRFIGKALGKQDVVNRLLGSLQVDISHTKETLDWSPPQSLEDGFKETAEAFLKNKEKNK